MNFSPGRFSEIVAILTAPVVDLSIQAKKGPEKSRDTLPFKTNLMQLAKLWFGLGRDAVAESETLTSGFFIEVPI